MIVDMAALTWNELDELNHEETLVFLPISPLEQHGPHLPIGLDFYGTEYLARRTAEHFTLHYPDWTVLLPPGLPLGSNAFDMPGAMFTRQRLLRDVLIDYAASLCRHGFKNIVMMSVHGGTGHIVAMEEACAAINKRFEARTVSPAGALAMKFFSGAYEQEIDEMMPEPLSPEEKELLRYDWHAGRWETSLMMVIAEDMVKEGYRNLKPVIVEDFRKINDDLIREAGGGAGYLGDPARASVNFGETMIKLLVRDAVTIIEKIVVQGEKVTAEERSPLYDIPFMRTDFVRNSVAVGAGVLLTILGGIPLVDAVMKGSLQIPGWEAQEKNEEETDS